MSKPVILIQDAAIDEYMSVVLLATMPDVAVLGIVIVNADCMAAPAMETQWKIQSFIGRTDIPAGLSNARGFNAFPWEYRVDCVKEGQIPALADILVPAWPTFPDGDALLAQLMDAADEPVTLLVTSPLTPVATLLQADPSRAAKIAELVWMGGAIDVPGNLDPNTVPAPSWNGTAEWNAFWDPYAVDYVFQNTSFPITLFPLDITDQAKVADSFMSALQAQSAEYPFSALAYQSYSLVSAETFYDMWDVVTTCWLSRPDLFAPPSAETLGIETSLNGPQGTLRAVPGGRDVNVVLNFAAGAQPFYDYVLAQFQTGAPAPTEIRAPAAATAEKATSAAPIPVLIDTDVDIDDWMAMLYLLKHPGVQVLGISTTGVGAAHLTPGTRNALNLLPLAGQPDIPVAAGFNAALVYSNQFPNSIRADIDDVFGITLPANPNGPSSQDAVTFLYETLMAAPAPVTILAIGGLTNPGMLLRDHPDAAQKIARIVVMGGAIDEGGNVNVVDPDYANTVAEWNIFLDPLGAQITFQSGVPITLVPLDASKDVPLDTTFYQELCRRQETPAAQFVLQALTQDFDFVKSGNFYFWDPLAAAVVTNPELVTTQQMNLSVVQTLNQEADTSGQLVQDAVGSPITVAMAADADAFKALFLDVLNLPDQARTIPLHSGVQIAAPAAV